MSSFNKPPSGTDSKESQSELIMEENLQKLGSWVQAESDAELDELLDPARRLRQRTALILALSKEERSLKWRRLWIGSGVLATGVAAVFFFSVSKGLKDPSLDISENHATFAQTEQKKMPEAELAIHQGKTDVSPDQDKSDSEVFSASLTGGTQLREGAWLGAEKYSRQIQFSDGSLLELSNDSSVRFDTLSKNAVRLSLESGHAEFSVDHHEGQSWIISAGPHQVEIVGTEFSIDWQPTVSAFELAVKHGTVRWSLAEDLSTAQLVNAGQKVTSASLLNSAELKAKPSNQALKTTKPRGAAVVETQEAVSHEAPRASWKELAAQGHFAEAMEQIESLGFESVLAPLQPDGIVALADAARLSGNTSRAKQALQEMRSRFPSHPQSVVAAFALGRIAGDIEHDDLGAIRWLKAFIAEGGSDELLEGARSRLMRSYQRLGKSSEAKSAASDYLRYHPFGAQAAQAKEILQKK